MAGILVVEDEPGLREPLVGSLRFAGFEVVSAAAARPSPTVALAG